MTLRVRCLLVCMAVFLTCSAPAVCFADQLDLVGEYLIKGWNPGNEAVGAPDYEGEATLRPWGDVLSYRGFMDSMTYAGAGIFDEAAGTLSLSFTNVDGTERGVTVLKVNHDVLQGRWVMDNGGDGQTGSEIWSRK